MQCVGRWALSHPESVFITARIDTLIWITVCASINSFGNRFCGKNEVLSNDYETHMGLIAFNRFHVSKNDTLEIAWRLMAMNIIG